MQGTETFKTGILARFSTYARAYSVSSGRSSAFSEEDLELAGKIIEETLDILESKHFNASITPAQLANEVGQRVGLAAALNTLITHFLADNNLSQANLLLLKYVLALKNDGCSISTIKNYRSDINQFFEFTEESALLKMVTKPKLQAFLMEQKAKHLADSSIRRKLVSITQFGIWLELERIVPAHTFKWLIDFNEHFGSSSQPNSNVPLVESTNNTHEEQRIGLNRSSQNSNWRAFVFGQPARTGSPLEAISSKTEKSTSPLRSQEKRFQVKQGLYDLRSKLQARSQQYILPYLNLMLSAILFLGMGYFGYLQVFGEVDQPLAFPTALTRPNRTLSFQGRLTDTNQNPIIATSDMRFRLYDSGPSTSGGTLLWDSSTCSVVPDQDGIFSVGLGEDCGSEISSDVFSENANVWLQVEVEGEVLDPRQSIKSVAYALNSETLQGFPPADTTTGATNNTVLVMNNSGEVILGQNNPKLDATSGTFTIEAQTLTLQTGSGSNGNINLDPDGTGKINLLANVDVNGYIKAPGATLSATYAGGTALTLNAGPSATADIMRWQNSAGSTLGLITSAGNIGIGTTSASNELEINAATPVIRLLSGGTQLSMFGHDGTNGNIYNYTGNMQITNIANSAMRLGTNNTTRLDISAGGDFDFNSGDVSFINSSGNVGIGDSTPTYKLDVNGTGRFVGAVDFDADVELNGTLTDVNNQVGTSGQVLSSTGTGVDWIDLPAGAENYWRINLGALSPYNDTLDLLIGANSTASAKFAVINVNSGTPAASVSSGVNGTGTYMTADGTLATTRRQSLNIGNTSTYNTTGNVYINPNGTGNVGIGTTTTGSRLDVVGTTGDANIAQFIGQRDGQNVNVYFKHNSTADVNNTARLTFQLNTTVQQRTAFEFISGFSDVTDATRTSYTYFAGTDGGSYGNRMALVGSDFGIGTITPTARLDINGTASTSATLSFRGTTDPKINILNGEHFGIQTSPGGNAGLVEKITLLNSGNFGIGSTSPGTTLDVTGTGRFSSTLTASNGLTQTTGALNLTATSGTISLSGMSASSLNFGANNVTFTSGNFNTTATGINSTAIGATTPSTAAFTTLSANSTVTLTGLGTGTDNTVLILNASNQVTTDEIDSRVWGTSLVDGAGTANRVTYWTDADTVAADDDFFFNGTNVGIGTTNPASFKLQVAGNIGPNADSTYNLGSPSLAWANVYGDTIYQNGNQVCDLSGNCASLGSYWRLNQGTISPVNDTLDLLVGSNATASAKFAAINVNSGTPAASVSSGVSGNSMFMTADGSLSTTRRQSLNIGNTSTYNTTGNVFINPNGTGNVGIGTTSSASRLEVFSTALNTDVQRWIASDGSRLGRFTETSGGHGWFEVDNSSGTAVALFRADGGASYISSGSVGIGTTTPTAQLDIAGSASTSGTLAFRGTTDPKIDILNGEAFGIRTSVGGDVGLAERFTVLNSGNVGIGTTNPTQLLEVAGNITLSKPTNPTFLINSEDGALIQSNGQAIYFDIDADNDGTGGQFQWRNNASSALMTLLEGGNFGIGTTTPDFKLQVDGTIAPETTDQDLGTTSLRWDLFANTIDADSTVTLTGLGTGTDNTVLILNGSNQVTTDEIDSRVWGTSLVDGAGTTGYVAYWTDADTLASEQYLSTSRGGLGANVTAAGAGEILYSTSTTSYDSLAAGTAGYILKSNGAGAPSWIDPITLDTTNFWRINSGAISPVNDTLDLFVGANATASAKFAVLNVNSGTPAASVSSGVSGNSMFMTADGTLSTTRRQSLTIGNSSTYDTTGNVLINSNGTGNVGVGTTNPTDQMHLFAPTGAGGAKGLVVESVNGIPTIKIVADTDIKYGSVTFFDRDTSTEHGGIAIERATPIVTSGLQNDILLYANSGSGSNIRLATEGSTRLTINTTGSVGIGSTSPGQTLDVTGTGRFSSTLTASNGLTQTTGALNLTATSGTLSLSGMSASSLNFGANNVTFTAGNFNTTATGINSTAIGATTPSTAAFTTLSANSTVTFSGLGTGTDNTVLILNASNQVTTDEIDARVWATSLVDGAGTANRVTYWTDADTVAADDDFFFNGTSVGIGTTNPGVKLDIVGGNAAQLRLRNVTTDATLKNGYLQVGHYTNAEEDFLGMLMQSGASSNDLYFGGSSSVLNSATALHFYTAANNTTLTGSERMTIISDGNVGINDSTPTYKLDVNGTGRFTGAVDLDADLELNSTLTDVNNQVGTSGQVLSSTGTGVDWIDLPAATAQYWRLNLGTISPVNNTLDLLVGSNATSSAKFAFMNVNSGTPTASIAGNLAIAVPTGANPATTYDVMNGGSFSLRTSVGGAAGLTDRVSVTNEGNVGIGVGTPNTLFHVRRGTNGSVTLDGLETDVLIQDWDTSAGVARLDLLGGSSGAGVLAFNDNAASAGEIRYNHNDDSLRFKSNATENLSLLSDGNFGIGDTTPTYRLDVNGTGRFTGAVDFDGDIELNSTLTDVNGSVGTSGQVLTSTSTGVDWVDATTVGTDDQTLAEVLLQGNNAGATGIDMNNQLITNIGNAGTDFVSGGGLTLAGTLTANGAFTLGDTGDTGAINTSDWVISTTGAMTGISGITNDSTFTTSGGAVNINASSNFATNINTGSSSGALTLGGGSNNVAINSSVWGITSAGVGSGFTGLTSSGTITFSGITANRLVTTTTGGQLTTSISSANAALSFSDETGSGLIVFSTSPEINNSITTGTSTFDLINSTATTVNFAGAASTLNIGPGSTTATSINLAGGSGATGCTVDGATGNFTCTGTINGANTIWQYLNGAISPSTPYTNNADLLVGSNATASAKFAVLNVLNGTPTASVSSGLSGNSMFMTADGTLSTRRRQTLTIGNSSTYDTTGNVLINSNGTGNVGIGGTNTAARLDVTGTGRFSSTLTASSGLTLTTGALNLTATSGTISLSGMSASSLSFGANNVTFTAGNFNTTATGINSTAIGATTPSTGAFTTLSANSTVTLSGLGTGTDNTVLILNGSNQVTTDEIDARVWGTTLVDGTTGTANRVAYWTDTDTIAADNDFFFDGTNVGIGTVTATQKLHVQGDMRLTGALYDVNNQAGGAGQVLSSTGTGVDWIDLPVGVNYWRLNAGAISPVNDTLDLLVGSNATASAKFAVLNVNSGTPAASVSSGLSGNSMFVTSDGSLSTTNRQSLTIGNSSTYDTTGNVLINSNGTGNVGIGTTAPAAKLHVAGDILLNNGEALQSMSPNGNARDLMWITTGSNGQTRLRMFRNANTFSYADWYWDTVNSRYIIADTLGGSVYGGILMSPTVGTTSSVTEASSGTPIKDNTFTIQGQYWDGATTVSRDATIVHNITSTSPASQLDFSIAGSTYLSLLDNGNLGIGTTDPASFKLQVAGSVGPHADDTYDLGSDALRWKDLYLGGDTLHIGSSTTDEGTISYNTSTNVLGISTDSTTNGDIAFFTDDLYLDKSSGSVGIGTTLPLVALDVRGSVAAVGTNPSLAVGDSLGAGDYGYLNWNTASDILILSTQADTATMALTEAGNVGIGTTVPSSFKLEVAGNVGPSANNTYDLGSSSKKWANIYGTNIYQNGSQVCDFSGNCSALGNLWQYTNGAISPATPYNNNSDFLIGSTATASAKFAVLNVFPGSGTPAASVSSGLSGNSAYLTADGTLATQNRASLTIGNSSTYDTTGNVLINPNGTGNVGIGTTTSTNSKLSIYGVSQQLELKQSDATNANSRISLTDSTGTSYGFLETGKGSQRHTYANAFVPTSGDLALYTPQANALHFGTSDLVRMTILSGGSVGIGSTSPGTTLDVTGTGRFSSTLTASNGLTQTTGALNLTATSGTISLSGMSASSLNFGANNVTFTAGNFNTTATGINSTAIGATTRSTAAFTTLAANSTVTFSGLGTGTDNTVLILNASNQVTTDEIDARVWGTSLVDGAGTANYVARWTDADTLGTGLVYDTGTSVGIGTTTPTRLLQIESASNPAVSIKTSATERGTFSVATATDAWFTGTAANDTALRSAANLWLGTLNANDINFSTTNVNRMIITSGGSVGIGITGPAATLHVASGGTRESLPTSAVFSDTTDTTEGLFFGYNSTSNYGIIAASDLGAAWHNIAIQPTAGNVGIGTTGPGATLQIGAAAGTEGAMSTTFRSYAGALGGTLGNEVVAGSIGFGAASNTVALGVRGYRTATGTTWTTTSIGLGMDVDGTARAGGVIWLSSNTNVGISSVLPGQKLDVTGNIRSSGQLMSTVATGTAPLSVASTTLVGNLNADEVDGHDADTAYNSFGNGTVPVRHASGYLFSNYYNMTANDVTSGVTMIPVETGNDGYLRWGNAAAVIGFLNGGTGLDADTLDGLNSSVFLRNDTDNSVASSGVEVTFPSGTTIANATGDLASLEVYGSGGASTDAFMQFHVPGDYAVYFGLDGGVNDLVVGGWSMGATQYRIWHAGNDGTGSGLDADLLDGLNSAQFLRSDTNDTTTGTLTAAGMYSSNWFRATGDSGLYFETYGTGLRSPLSEGGTYGSVSTYGGEGGWEGYSIDGKFVFMSDLADVGIYNDINNRWIMHHDTGVSTTLYEPDSTTVAMTINVNGNVGIGNGVSPTNGKLETVAGGGQGIYVTSTSGTAILGISSTGTGLYGGATSGVGTYSYATTGTAVYATGGSGIGVYGVSTGAGNGGVEGVNNTSGGYGVFGQTTIAYAVYGLATSSGRGVHGEATATTGQGVRGTGVAGGGYDFFAAGGGVDYGTSSSIRWKSDLAPIQNSLEKVLNMRGLYYTWDQEHGGARDMGMIAEEVMQYVPEVVAVDPTAPGYATGMDYGKLTPILVEAIKEQNQQVQAIANSMGAKLTFTTEGELAINGSNGNYTVTASGNTLTTIIGASKAVIGKITAGLVTTRQLVVQQTATIADLSVTTMKVSGQNISDYIRDIVQQELQTTSLPSGSVASNFTTDDLNVTNSASISGNLKVSQNATISGTLLANQIETNSLSASTSALGSLLANTATVSGDLTVEQDASVAGTLIAGQIEAQSSRFQTLESRMAELESIKAQTAELVDATVSGTLYADNIYNFDEKVAGSLQKPSLLQLLTNTTPPEPEAASPASIYEPVEMAGYASTNPDLIATDSAILQLDETDVVLGSSALFVEKYLEVNGHAYVAQTLGIGETLKIGNSLIFNNGTINYQPAGDANPVLAIQSSGQGKLDFLAGVMTIEHGQVAITGDLTIAGRTKTDTLLTNLVQPADFGNPFQVQVAGASTESGEIKKSRFEIINETGEAVATFDADGNASFRGGISVANQDLADEELDDNSVTTDKSSGQAKLASGKTDIKIKTPKANPNSLIYVTPKGSTDNKVLYIKGQGEEEFTVGFDDAIDQDVEFNWWIVN